MSSLGLMSNPLQKKLFRDAYPDYSPPYPLQQDRTFVGLGNPLYDGNPNFSNPTSTYQSVSSGYSTPYSHTNNASAAMEAIAHISSMPNNLSSVTLPDFQFAQKYGMIDYEQINKKLIGKPMNSALPNHAQIASAMNANQQQRTIATKEIKEPEFREQKWFNSMDSAINYIENEYEDREWAQYNWSYKLEENRVRGVCHCSGVSYKNNGDEEHTLSENSNQRRKKPKLNKIANEPISNIFSKKNNCQRSIEIKKINDMWRLNIFARHVEISCEACKIYRKINKKLRNWFYDLFAAGHDFYQVKAAYDTYLNKNELILGTVPPPGPTFAFKRDNPVWYPNNKSLRNIERLAKRDKQSSMANATVTSTTPSSDKEKNEE